MKKNIVLFISFLGLFFAKSVSAVCPVCTVAVVAGVGLSRWLGIDDTISGTWIGGLTVSLIFWTLNWLNKKNYNFPAKEFLTIVGYYALIVVPLFFTDVIGHPLNKLWGVDKILLGIIAGSVSFFAATTLYEWMKRRHDGRAYFPYQKVAMPIASLLIFSLAFYLLT
ncbi:MAG: hypothetical protein ACM3KM_03655 [Acidobacteriaceae bacterium]